MANSLLLNVSLGILLHHLGSADKRAEKVRESISFGVHGLGNVFYSAKFYVIGLHVQPNVL